MCTRCYYIFPLNSEFNLCSFSYFRQIIQENSVWSALNFFYVAVLFQIYKIWKTEYKTIKDSGYVLKGKLYRQKWDVRKSWFKYQKLQKLGSLIPILHKFSKKALTPKSGIFTIYTCCYTVHY